MPLHKDHSNISVFETPEKLAVAAAERFVGYADEAHKGLDRFSVALAGGRTPQRLYELLATDYKSRIEWSRVHLFFSDERCVPVTHPDSNYALVLEALVSKVTIPAENVHRMIGEFDPNQNARNYEDKLREFFGTRDWPRFDLIFLGMGEDGHTASLFPQTEELKETSRWVVATRNEYSGHRRLTLTVAAINQGAHIVFLVTGKSKAAPLSEVLSGKFSGDRLPASRIQPANGTLEWFVDTAAASEL